MNYYISDTHFGHRSIIRLCNRPFGSVEEMDAALIENWNRVVKKNDDVYIVGDFAWKTDKTIEILKTLQGKKHLVVGNHDRKLLKDYEFRKQFVEIHNVIEVRDKGCYEENRRIILCHYPMVEWDGFFRETWHFFGHIHNSENQAQKVMRNIPRAVNVSADCNGFFLRTAEELMVKKLWEYSYEK